MEQSDIWWLVVGTITGAVTSALLHCVAEIFSKCKSTIQETTFQYLAKRFDLAEHTFKNMTNSATIPRLLEQLDLRTYKYMWLHEANAAANDSVQHGYIRLPTKSIVCKFLAICHISHYIWISSDLQSIHIVAPSVSVTALIKISNQAATRRMTSQEERSLKATFGCDAFVTDVDATFIRYERVTLLTLSCIGACCTFLIRKSSPLNYYGLVVTMLLISLSIYTSWKGATSWLMSQCYKVLCNGCWNALHFNVDTRDSSSYNYPLLDGTPESEEHEEYGADHSNAIVDLSTEHSAVFESTGDTRAVVNLESNTMEIQTEASTYRTYSLVLSIDYYYAVMQEMSIQLSLPGQIMPNRGVSLYVSSECQDFTNVIASTIASQNLVYVCVYNPMNDPPLYKIRDLIANGQKDSTIFLVIILPPMHFFEQALQEHCDARLRTQKCSQYVATMCDFEDLLMKASTGFLTKDLVFVVPVAANISEEELQQKQIWKSAQSILGNGQCHYINIQSARRANAEIASCVMT